MTAERRRSACLDRGHDLALVVGQPVAFGCAAKCRALAASPGPLKTRAASGICHGVELVRMAQKRCLRNV
jgi:hypothetical protein